MLKSRRDAQAGHLAEYQHLLDRSADFTNKAPDLIGRAGMVSEEMAQQLALVLLTVEEAKQGEEDLVYEYKRILRDYDRKIQLEEAAHSAHVEVLRIVDSIRPKLEAAGRDAGAMVAPTTNKPGLARGSQGGALGDRIHDVVSGGMAEVNSRVMRRQFELSRSQLQMGPERSIPAQQWPATPSQQASPDFTGTITPYSN
jgi:hypothetical protein